MTHGLQRFGIAHGVTEFWTADRDFSRFPDLVARNPLQD